MQEEEHREGTEARKLNNKSVGHHLVKQLPSQTMEGMPRWMIDEAAVSGAKWRG
jgi:hypothetical protein